jgi:hypothetical protein
MNKLQESAYDILCQISDGDDSLDEINRAAAKLFDHDFSPSMALMPDKLREAIVGLIGEILEPGAGEHNIAVYWLYEAKGMKEGGSITLKDGRVYPIKTLADVGKYVRENT